MSHLTSDVLNLYLDDELANGDRQTTEAHLRACADCRQELAALREFSARLGDLPPEPLPRDVAPLVMRRIAPARPAWRVRVGAGVLAAQLIAVVLVAAWLVTQSSRPDLLGPGWAWLAAPAAFLVSWTDPVIPGSTAVLSDVGDVVPATLLAQVTPVWGILVTLAGVLWLVGNRLLLADGLNSTQPERGRS
jgi:anti-sigma factor RsiW